VLRCFLVSLAHLVFIGRRGVWVGLAAGVSVHIRADLVFDIVVGAVIVGFLFSGAGGDVHAGDAGEGVWVGKAQVVLLVASTAAEQIGATLEDNLVQDFVLIVGRLGLDLYVNVFNLQTVVIALDQRHRQPLLDREGKIFASSKVAFSPIFLAVSGPVVKEQRLEGRRFAALLSVDVRTDLDKDVVIGSLGANLDAELLERDLEAKVWLLRRSRQLLKGVSN